MMALGEDIKLLEEKEEEEEGQRLKRERGVWVHESGMNLCSMVSRWADESGNSNSSTSRHRPSLLPAQFVTEAP
jgi:hypothetical protein